MTLPKYQVEPTVENTHQFFVAVLILSGVGIILVILAGEDENAGKGIVALLSIMLLVQGITKVNPLVAFLANHPLIPKTGNAAPTTSLPNTPNTIPMSLGGGGGRPPNAL